MNMSLTYYVNIGIDNILCKYIISLKTIYITSKSFYQWTITLKYTHKHIHIHINTYTYIHTHLQTYTHLQIYTHTHTASVTCFLLSLFTSSVQVKATSTMLYSLPGLHLIKLQLWADEDRRTWGLPFTYRWVRGGSVEEG